MDSSYLSSGIDIPQRPTRSTLALADLEEQCPQDMLMLLKQYHRSILCLLSMDFCAAAIFQTCGVYYLSLCKDLPL